MEYPSSCDTFVALPPATASGRIIFGKNSDRPASEVQEIIFCQASEHSSGSSVQCTYLEIPQVSKTYATILSKPAWTWGAEMGANSEGVVIGNEAVWTKECGEGDSDEKLLGMDLVRLGLERGGTAKEALEIITCLLQEHGQGGRCFEDPARASVTYHNSFIIADGNEAWVLETAGKHWAAERVTEGVRNISNQLSIGSKIDLSSDGLSEHAKNQGWWSPDDGDFDFSKAFASTCPVNLPECESPSQRFEAGCALMKKFSINHDFGLTSMFQVLRDEDGNICRTGKSGTVSAGSMVSVLVPNAQGVPSFHWLTATPNPACSVFKPFVFCADADIGPYTISPTYGNNDPVKVVPRFQSEVDRKHPLYAEHAQLKPLPGNDFCPELKETMFNLERECVNDVEEFMANYQANQLDELSDLFKDVVDAEIKLYKAARKA